MLNELSEKSFNMFIENIGTCKPVAVFGDIGLDTYLNGDVNRISPEAPVVVVNTQTVEHMIGLAGNVALNLSKLGIPVKLFSVIGQDSTGKKLHELMCENNLDCRMRTDVTRPTTEKMRIMGKNQHICRVDTESTAQIGVHHYNLLNDFLEEIDEYGALIIQDYNKGLFDFKFTQKLISHAKSHNIPVFVDPHPSKDIKIYSQADYLKPNIKEARSLVDSLDLVKKGKEYSPEELCKYLQKLTGTMNIILTMGKDGIYAQNGRTSAHLPSMAKNIVEVSGAGDTVIALVCASVLCGLTFQDAVAIGNLAASIVVAKPGTSTLSIEELKTEFKRINN